MQPDFTQLLHMIEEMPAYRWLREGLKQSSADIKVMVLDTAKPYLIAALCHSLKIPVLMVTAQPENAKNLYEQLLVWCNSSKVKLYPEPDALPYQRIALGTSTGMERLQVLAALVSGESTIDPPLVVASAPALVQKTTPYHDFISSCHTIKVGMKVEPFQLLGQWEAMGYRRESIVEVPGTVSHRGGIIDIYPPTSDLPARLDFFGNTVDSIRFFDPANQRSLRAVPSCYGAANTTIKGQTGVRTRA